LQRAALAVADGAIAAGTAFLAEARTALERLAAAEPTSRIFPTRLAAVWVLEARIRLATGRDDALAAAEQAIALAAPVVAGDRADVWISAELAQALLLAGRIERSLGRTEPARARWERALAVLQRWLAARPNDSLVLDPAAQAHVLLQQPALAQPLAERLRGFGYRPLDPLAASTLDLAR